MRSLPRRYSSLPTPQRLQPATCARGKAKLRITKTVFRLLNRLARLKRLHGGRSAQIAHAATSLFPWKQSIVVIL
eukprot:3688781-Pleurochrysis_carterae.AAC.1